MMNEIFEKYFIIYRNTDSIGDQLLISAILKKITEKYNRPIILFITHPELFDNNPYVYKSINYKNLSEEDKIFLFKDTIYENNSELGIVLLMNKIRKSKSEFVCEFAFQWMHKKNANIKKSLVEFYSSKLNIDTHGLIPEIYLSNEEKNDFLHKFHLPENYYVIQSEGIKETEFKNYGVGNMQKIVDMTKDKIKWVQIGTNDNRKLNNVIDLAGKLNLREMCCCINFCEKALSIHGLYTLIATSFNKINFCIISDYQYSEQTPYDNIIFIKRNNFHNDTCNICNGWYCGCKNSIKYGWQNDIKPEHVVDIILNKYDK